MNLFTIQYSSSSRIKTQDTVKSHTHNLVIVLESCMAFNSQSTDKQTLSTKILVICQTALICNISILTISRFCDKTSCPSSDYCSAGRYSIMLPQRILT